jgi:hypothetical protein
MLRCSLPCFKVSRSISRPVFVWRRVQHYDVMDSANVPPDFEKLRPIEAKVSRAGKTQRMILRVFASRDRSLPTLAVSTPVAVRRGSINHRGKKFRIRAPRNISDCGYTRLLDRLGGRLPPSAYAAPARSRTAKATASFIFIRASQRAGYCGP